jgi:uncharacterized protein with NRDE domain
VGKGQMAYLSNRKDPMKPQMVDPGFHVLCNGLLNTPWPKVGLEAPYNNSELASSLFF